MTETRKEFEQEMRFSEEFRDGSIYRFSFMTEAWRSWQACQSLNDKRIEQLLAVIAKKDEALQEIACMGCGCDSWEYCRNNHGDIADEALALQPADVELVEIGEARIIDINGTGTFVWKKGNMPALAENPKLYTIKTKARTK